MQNSAVYCSRKQKCSFGLVIYKQAAIGRERLVFSAVDQDAASSAGNVFVLLLAPTFWQATAQPPKKKKKERETAPFFKVGANSQMATAYVACAHCIAYGASN